MPLSACPGIVQTYLYKPLFSLTVSGAADLPLRMSLVFLPAILRSGSISGGGDRGS
jgi:hypothetical protein